MAIEISIYSNPVFDEWRITQFKKCGNKFSAIDKKNKSRKNELQLIICVYIDMVNVYEYVYKFNWYTT